MKKQPNRRFWGSDLVLKVIMDCRADESCNFKRKLGFKLHDVSKTKEKTVLKSTKDAFEGEEEAEGEGEGEVTYLSRRIDLYFHKHKLAFEFVKLGYADRNLSNEIERQKVVEK